MTTDDLSPHADDDVADDGLAVVELARRDPTTPRPRGRTWWYVGAAAAVVVVGMVVGILVFNSSASDNRRGTVTARDAAQQYVTALNAGNSRTAVGITCDRFANQARAVARSGHEGIRFTLMRVRAATRDSATAAIRAALSVGGARQTQNLSLQLVRTDGLWLVCGQG